MDKILLCVIYIIFSVAGLIMVKYGNINPVSNSFIIPILNVAMNVYSILGLLSYGISFILYMGVITKFDLGYIIPIIGGIVNVLILIASVLIFNNDITGRMLAGALMIIFGIVIMNI